MKSKTPSPSVSALDAHLGFWMRFVSNQVSAEFERAVEARGVSVSEWVALRTLYGQADATHAALMAALGMTKGAVSKVVSRLQDKGLVTRESHEADARAQVLALTRAGRALVPALARHADADDERFFGHLSAKQRRDLMALPQQMVQLRQLAEGPVACASSAKERHERRHPPDHCFDAAACVTYFGRRGETHVERFPGS